MQFTHGLFIPNGWVVGIIIVPSHEKGLRAHSSGRTCCSRNTTGGANFHHTSVKVFRIIYLSCGSFPDSQSAPCNTFKTSFLVAMNLGEYVGE